MAKRKPKTPPPKKAPAKSPPAAPAKPATFAKQVDSRNAYELKREKAGTREREKAAEGKDIAPAPFPKDLKAREKGLADPEFFLREYFPRTFYRPFSRDHKAVIESAAETLENGGNQARAVFRGWGKTALFVRLALWAIARKHRRYVTLIGATAPLSRNLLVSMKNELQFNEKLAEDFPDLCFCFRALEDMAARARGQTYERVKTGVRWEGHRVVFGYLPTPDKQGYYPCSGAVIQVSSLQAASRGMFFLGRDGKNMRPDFVFLDDPQTDRSARSLDQCRFREQLIKQSLLGMAGGNDIMSAFAAVTPIEADDLAERLLDRDRFPEWHGRRYPLIKKFPTNTALWDEYFEKLAFGYRSGDSTGKGATAFYKKNRKAMLAGAEVADEHFFAADAELDALQHAMNLKAKNPDGFGPEYQMETRVAKTDSRDLRPEELFHRASGVERGMVPMASQVVSAYIDVQHKALYWAAGAYSQNLGGAVIDYGTWPEQHRPYFTLAEIKTTLATQYKGHSFEAFIRAGLVDLLNHLFGRVWRGEDNVDHRLAACLIDAADGRVADIVHEVCRSHPIAAGRVFPAIGKGIGPTDRPMALWRASVGERKGDHWILRRSATRGGSKHLLIDTNRWKSAVADRLQLPPGDRNAILLPGKRPGENRMLCDQLCAETRTTVTNEKDGSQCEVWRRKPDRPDNHLGDAVIGSVVAATLTGLQLLSPSRAPAAGSSSTPNQPRERVKYHAL